MKEKYYEVSCCMRPIMSLRRFNGWGVCVGACVCALVAFFAKYCKSLPSANEEREIAKVCVPL